MASQDDTAYEQTSSNTVKRFASRARYDYSTVHHILQTTPILHVAFACTSSPFPAVLPMIGVLASYTPPSSSSPSPLPSSSRLHSETDLPLPSDLARPLDLYLHGYVSSRLMRLGRAASHSVNDVGDEDDEGEGLPVTVAAAEMDGLVLSLTPGSHSLNYRSAVVQGYAKAVTDPEEKAFAMKAVTEKMLRHRWEHVRVPPNKGEMSSTQVLKVTPVHGSAKIRAGGPGDDRADMQDESLRARTWVGVVPTYRCYGQPAAAEYNKMASDTLPTHITDYIAEQNAAAKKNAELMISGTTLHSAQT